MRFTDMFMWIILASVAVLVIMNASGAATVISSLSLGVADVSTVLTGSDYRKPR